MTTRPAPEEDFSDDGSEGSAVYPRPELGAPSPEIMMEMDATIANPNFTRAFVETNVNLIAQGLPQVSAFEFTQGLYAKLVSLDLEARQFQYLWNWMPAAEAGKN